MLRARIIPVLLLRNKGLVKTTKFSDDKYVGDPLNAVRIFNEKQADELTFLDIHASIERREPDYKMIANLANECRMPLCYGGGIKTAEQARYILSLGVEKVALGSVLFERPEIVHELAATVGRQSVVGVLDVKKRLIGSKYECYTYNGKKAQKRCPVEFVGELERLGVGEILINSIDNDGVMKGYDHRLVDQIKSNVNVPITVLGGASGYDDIKNLIAQHSIIGAGAGSAFVFKGKYRAVLINYPTPAERAQLNFSGHQRIQRIIT